MQSFEIAGEGDQRVGGGINGSWSAATMVWHWPWLRFGSMDATMKFMTDLQNVMIAISWRVDLLAMA